MDSIDPYLSPLMPADADGDTPPPANAPAPLVSINQDGSGLPQDQIQIWNATVDWGSTPSITVTHNTDVQAAPFDENLCDFSNCIPQPGTSVKLQTLSDRIMHRAQYRNFGTWSTIVTSHSVDVGSDRAGRAGIPPGEAGQRRLGNARPGGHLRPGRRAEPLAAERRHGQERRHAVG